MYILAQACHLNWSLYFIFIILYKQKFKKITVAIYQMGQNLPDCLSWKTKFCETKSGEKLNFVWVWGGGAMCQFRRPVHSLFKSLFTIALAVIIFQSSWFCFAAAECYLPPDPGPCLAYFPRYYYDIHSGTCEEFIYGGCAGNSNNFHNQGECLHVCQSHFLMFKEFD